MRAPATHALVFGILAATAAPAAPPVQAPACGFVIRHVSVFQTDSVLVERRFRGWYAPDRDVTVCGRRIVSVARAAPDAPHGARPARLEVDGRGRYLIPGLWDAHVHAFAVDFPRWAAPLMLANGVTSARDMGFFPDTATAARAGVARGRIAGPRLLVGLRVDGPGQRPRWVLQARTEADGRRAVQVAARHHMDFVKVYSSLPEPAYRGISREGARLRMPVDGHLPYAVPITEAFAFGQRTIEHEDDIMRACTRGDSAIGAAMARNDRAPEAEVLATVREVGRRMRLEPDEARCRQVIAGLASAHVALTPTLVVYQPYAHRRSPRTVHPERDGWVPPALRADWERRLGRVTAADTMVVRGFFSFPRTRAAAEMGVRLLVGTDAPLPYVLPGFGVHDELRLLVEAGLTPAEALRAATVHPARTFAMQDSLGTIAPGMLADLVLLDANPLKDIRNTTHIAAVVANGVLLQRPALDALLARAARFANP